MTNDEWAVICTLNQVPRYKFVGSEKKLAQRMAQDGLLRADGDNFFASTPKGKRDYNKMNTYETK